MNDRDPESIELARQRRDLQRRRERLDEKRFEGVRDGEVGLPVGTRMFGSRTPESLQDVLGRLQQRRSWAQRMERAELQRQWPDVVGVELAARCAYVGLDGDVLRLATINQAWATEIRGLQRRIITRVNKALGSPVVMHLDVRIDPSAVGHE